MIRYLAVSQFVRRFGKELITAQTKATATMARMRSVQPYRHLRGAGLVATYVGTQGGMMLGHWLNTIGLALGMAGVVMLFIWGPPQPSFQDHVPLSVQPGTVLRDGTRIADIIESNRQQKVRYAWLSRIGLALIGIGFAVQLWATWAQ